MRLSVVRPIETRKFIAVSRQVRQGQQLRSNTHHALAAAAQPQGLFVFVSVCVHLAKLPVAFEAATNISRF